MIENITIATKKYVNIEYIHDTIIGSVVRDIDRQSEEKKDCEEKITWECNFQGK